MTPYELLEETVKYKGKTYYVDDADYSEISLLKYRDDPTDGNPWWEEWFEVPWREHKKMEVIK